MAEAVYNLQNLIDKNTTWQSILDEMGVELPDNEFVPFTIAATYTDPTTQEKVTSTPITIYLHKCSFTPAPHHKEHTGTTPSTYNAAIDEALAESATDTLIHFVPEYTPQ